MSFCQEYLAEAAKIVSLLQPDQLEKMALILAGIRDQGGRLFILGVGGSAASASHAVNDFRKLCQFEAYCPTDNVSELTARTNDEGWETVFSQWLIGSHLNSKDAVLVLSVGGGDLERNISPNLVRALELAQKTGTAVLGIVGRDGGYTAKTAQAAIIIPPINPDHVTPHTEAFHGVVWHLLVTHPALKKNPTKW
ncbi:MAG: SIS domain-containing protein [Deltaproteobacteria bacterium]|jgi:D-sedoheptulose 7-phosphate isomerase|nr:SIS domain-containing protein [Deltaproteobacteria bacterium]